MPEDTIPTDGVKLGGEILPLETKNPAVAGGVVEVLGLTARHVNAIGGVHNLQSVHGAAMVRRLLAVLVLLTVALASGCGPSPTIPLVNKKLY
jgi:hypothetical protein